MAGSLPWPAEPLPLHSRRTIAVVCSVLIAALMLAGVWSLLTPNAYAPSRNGCVNVVVAEATGGALVRNCGTAAKAWCKSEYALQTTFARQVQAQCRLAGIEPPTRP